MKVNDNQRISGESLRAEIYRKGYTLQSASKTLGLTNNFFSNVIQKNRLRQHYFPIIEEKLGIKPEKYVKHIIHPTVMNVDGNMVRNIDVDFIRFRAHELGLPLKSFCPGDSGQSTDETPQTGSESR